MQNAFSSVVVAKVRGVTALVAEIDAPGLVVAERFGRHPDAEIITSQPGLGAILGARVLAEFGDDPDRYADATSRKSRSLVSAKPQVSVVYVEPGVGIEPTTSALQVGWADVRP
ncbi:MAG: hypothetical protein NVS3B26_18860 [Mycobacteriales bacterium]